MRPSLSTLLKERVLLLDGGMGTYLMNSGLKPGKPGEILYLGKVPTLIKCHSNNSLTKGTASFSKIAHSMAPSSSGQDSGLSRRQQGFDSPWGHHSNNKGLRAFLSPFFFIFLLSPQYSPHSKHKKSPYEWRGFRD